MLVGYLGAGYLSELCWFREDLGHFGIASLVCDYTVNRLQLPLHEPYLLPDYAVFVHRRRQVLASPYQPTDWASAKSCAVHQDAHSSSGLEALLYLSPFPLDMEVRT